MSKKPALVAGMVVATGLMLVGWLLFGDGIREYLARRPFDSVAWKAVSKTPSDPGKIRMVEDLLRRHQFRGATRSQVIALLGDPEKTGYFKDYDLVYWLGPDRGGFGIDSEWLVFRLDSEERVTDYRIVGD